ncbi:MAG: LLM class F420-dependent oxidoreductase [Streptosporangiaceae bacterium]|nr:LLM class F420-dependent oxidoreductase [Streptosporangiaceae bacterium]
MTRYGYFLSSEEYAPADLVRQARLAEQAGFDALWISDHFHPWLDEQGQSGFVWAVIGAISQAVSLPVTTAVTCPTIRMHPVLVAQAAATAGVLTQGRFTLGVGSGEALNEHVVGARWPSADERLEMLEEAVGLIRKLFTGKQVNHRGQYFAAETARLYSMPAEPPPIYMSGFGSQSVQLAARIADGYMSVMPEADMVRLYRESGGGDRPVQGGLKVCWDSDADRARKTMHRLWPNEEIPGEAAQLLPLPRNFEQLAQLVTEDMVSAPCGPDAHVHLAAIRQFTDAGFDEVYIGQVGGAPEAFFDFYATQVLPRAREN